MNTLTIRDIPDELNTALIQKAQQNRRSKEKHALFLLESAIRERPSAKQTMATAAQLRKQCQRATTLAEILKLTEENH